jgi:hypothetical protein
VTLYGGPFTKQDFLEFFSEPVEFDHAGMVTVALSREVGVLWKHIRWETEIGVTKWFGDQTHWEFTSAIVARWITFPWNDYVKTTIAVGDGPSFATKPPRLEKKNFDEAKRLQNYVFLELNLRAPALSAVGLRHPHPPSVRGIRRAGRLRLLDNGHRRQVQVLARGRIQHGVEVPPATRPPRARCPRGDPRAPPRPRPRGPAPRFGSI